MATCRVESNGIPEDCHLGDTQTSLSVPTSSVSKSNNKLNSINGEIINIPSSHFMTRTSLTCVNLRVTSHLSDSKPCDNEVLSVILL